MRTTRNMLATSFGLAVGAMLLAGASSLSAATVSATAQLGPTNSHVLEKSCFVLENPHLLIMTGYARALTHTGNSSRSRIELSIVTMQSCAKGSKQIKRDVCAVDRSMTKNVSNFNLYESATCVRRLEANTPYKLRAFHGIKNATKKSMNMDYALVRIP